MYDSHTGHPYANQYWVNNSINQTHKNKNFSNPNFNAGQGRSGYDNGGSRSRSREKFVTHKDSYPQRDPKETSTNAKFPGQPDAPYSGPGPNQPPAPPKTYPGQRSDPLDSPSTVTDNTGPITRGQHTPLEATPTKSPYNKPVVSYQKYAPIKC
jgi:hypothetical protein